MDETAGLDYIRFKQFSPVIFGDELEGIARLGGDEALETDEGGAAGPGYLEVCAVVIGATQTHLERDRKSQAFLFDFGPGK